MGGRFWAILDLLLEKGIISRDEYERYLSEPVGIGQVLNRLVDEGKLTLQEAVDIWNNFRGGGGWGKGWGRSFGRGRGWGKGCGRGFGWRHRFGHR